MSYRFFSVCFPENQSSYLFFSLGVFPGYLFSYRLCLFFSRNNCSHIVFFCFCPEHLFSYRFFFCFCFGASALISFFSGSFRSLRTHIASSAFWNICSYRFFSVCVWGGGGGVRSFCFHVVFDWLISEKLFYFLEVGIVFSLVFCRARIPKLHVCIVFADFCRTTYSCTGNLYRFSWVFSEQVFPGYKFISYSQVLSKHVLLYWKLAVPVFLLDICTVYAWFFFPEHLFSYSFILGGVLEHFFLILEACIVLADFFRACFPKLQVCIVFS